MAPRPTIVCLHGLGRSPADWGAVAGGLARFGEIHAPTLPRDPGEALAAAAAAVPDGAIVVAHSIGGVLALRLSREHGRRFGALILSDAFFPPARNGRGTGASVRDYLAHRVRYLSELRPARKSEASGAPRAGLAGALLGLIRLAARRSEFDAAAASVAAPVLVIHARDDHYVPIDFAFAAAARQRRWQVETLPTGGHFAHVTEARVWLHAALPWLAAQAG